MWRTGGSTSMMSGASWMAYSIHTH
jgi:hypothetical protein